MERMAEVPWRGCVLLLRWYSLCFLEYYLIDASTERVGNCHNFCVNSIRFSSHRIINNQFGFPLSLRLFGSLNALSHNLRHLFFQLQKDEIRLENIFLFLPGSLL